MTWMDGLVRPYDDILLMKYLHYGESKVYLMVRPNNWKQRDFYFGVSKV